ncbi:MAG: hypothetical protein AAFR88_11210 [Pseudomonadota bacterium]
MRKFHTVAALSLVALSAPACATEAPAKEKDAVANAVTDFLAAIGSEDKTAVADHMLPDGTIMVHNLMEADNPQIVAVPVQDHLKRWATRTGSYTEAMNYDIIKVSGTMAHVWGPYSFKAGTSLRHCGINSIHLLRTEAGWKVGNLSFTMVPPDQCAAVGADWVEGDDS